MRAVICSKFGSPEDLEVKEVEEPVTGANQVKLKVEACGVNFPDTLIINNKYQFKPDLPFSPGGEVAHHGYFKIGDLIEEGWPLSPSSRCCRTPS